MLRLKGKLEVEEVLKREMTSAKGAFEAILGNGWMRYRDADIRSRYGSSTCGKAEIG